MPDKHYDWMAVGCTPLMRFMRYNKSGEHYAHYDAGYFYKDGMHRTLMSYVIYLTTNNSGATRFINDNQMSVPVWDRVHNDWMRRTEENEVIAESQPVAGSILVFDHRLCHDVKQFMPENEKESRIIIRGDILYKKYQVSNS